MRRLLPLGLLLAIALLLLPTSFAQGRLNPPNYYLSQLPDLAPGATVEGELSPDDGQNFKDGSYLDLYALHGEEGEQVDLVAASLEFDTYLTLYDPDGRLLAWSDDGMYGTDAELLVTLPAAGRYLVVVSGYSDYDLGRYTLSRGAAASEAEAVELAVPGEHEGLMDEANTSRVPYLEVPGVPFRFTLAEPAALAFYLSSPTFDAYLVLTDGEGNVIAENDDENYSEVTGWNTDALLFAELGAGEYQLFVTSLYSTPHGEFTLRARRFVEAD